MSPRHTQTPPDAADAVPHWLVVGAGNIGTLAAWYLTRAGHGVTVLGPEPGTRSKTLIFADGRDPVSFSLTSGPAVADDQPVTHLALACKTPFTHAVLDRLALAPDIVVLRLQNGIADLHERLPTNARLIETVTTNAVRGRDPVHEVVAENQTFMGDGSSHRPPWFDRLVAVWPGLEWTADLRMRQWQKLVANAAINPLTAIHDVSNGALVDDPAIHARLRDIVAEADRLLVLLDPRWPGNSLADVEAVARATAANTSSMRADVHAGSATEIDAINGWLINQAHALGLRLYANEATVAELQQITGRHA